MEGKEPHAFEGRRSTMRVSLELTDGCNLRCVHCFKHLQKDMRFLDLALIARLLDQVEALGVDADVGLTGGEPTLHPELEELLALIADHGMTFSMVTNGVRFPSVLPLIERRRDHLGSVIFSLDGATPASNDRLRGPGSSRRVVEGLMMCRERGLATQINFVVTRSNRDELLEIVHLASNLGCRALGLAHCKPTPDARAAGLALDTGERRRLEADIADLQQTFRMPVLLAGDHWDPYPLALCPQLELRELHVDVRGRLTACCELSAFRGGDDGTDIVADLAEVSLGEAMRRLAARTATIAAAKAERLAAGAVTDADRFICTRCFDYYGKVAGEASSSGPDVPG
jgi:pyruvate-formate lyase-activating enzyme